MTRLARAKQTATAASSLPLRVRTITLATLCSLAFAANADETKGLEYSGSGFLSLTAGKMFGGTRTNVGDNNCPCFTADYAQGAVYNGTSNLQLKPDSKLGLQGTASTNDHRLSATAQVVSRGARDGKVNLEWIYGSYKASDEITLQVGRKRLPMFYYSDTQDIGVALPWTHLPPQLYGWEAVNYNGANVMIQTQLGSWSATANLLAGNESIKDAGYDRIYRGRRSRTDVKWENIVGGDLTLQKDWFETRFVYIQSSTRSRNVSGTWEASINDYDPTTIETEFTSPSHQRISGVAFNVDYHDWLARTEFIHINRPGLNFKDNAYIVAGGKRFGKWQLLLTQSRYWGNAVVDQGGDSEGQESHTTNSITVRYDLSTSSALKVQLDFQRDTSGRNWGIANDANSLTGFGPAYGNAKLLTVAYDMVF